MRKCPTTGDDNSIVLNLFITNACNLHCSHCYVDSCLISESSNAQFLDLNDLDFILKSLERENIELVHVFGGEPFLHPDLRDACEMCRAAGYPVNIATNGTLIQEHLSWLQKNGVSLSINMLGDDPRLSEILDDAFPLADVSKNARDAVQCGIEVNGIICAFPVEDTPAGNARFYAEYLRGLHESTGIEDFFILYFSRLGRGKRVMEHMNASFFAPEQWLSFLKELKEGLDLLKPSFSVFVEPAFEDEMFSALPPPPVQCEMIMQANLVIKYDLTAYPCILLLNSDDARHKIAFNGNLDKVDAAFSDVQAKTITRAANTCKFCTQMPYCGPCIAYIQDEPNDYRCLGNKTKGPLVGCPLATVRLY
ncbi:MAG TPA: radical SAM protein [Candidatus Lokiarchaeia archaeon]|nr:radical SAM protein [Candidatus Lokiarchaeia archaeon]